MVNYENPDQLLLEERFESEEEESKEPRNTDRDKKIFERYTARRKEMEAKWKPIHEEMRQDWAIYNLDQWTAQGSQARGDRPKLTVDITRKYVKSIIAPTHQNPPGVRLAARDDSAKVKATALADAIRYFEDRSGAIYAYSWSEECAAVGGVGWLKYSYEYDAQQAIRSMIRTNKVNDPFSIIIDPDSTELDGSDMIDAVELHGKTRRSKTGKLHKEKVTYWYKDEQNDQVKWAIIEGDTVESKGMWPGKCIPIVPVYGEYSIIDGKVSIHGVIRLLRDVQRSVNYTMSEGIERMALTPRSPWMMAKGSVDERDEKEYDRSLVEPVGRLYFNPFQDGDPTRPLQAPTRNGTTPDVQWISQVADMLLNQAKEITGIYDAGLGNEDTNAASGVAIRARQGASDRGQLVYSEHLQISIKRGGYIQLDLFEPVLGPGGILPTQKEDGSQVQYSTGEPTYEMDPQTGLPLLGPDGMPIVSQEPLEDFDATDLDISISSGQAYATRKQDGLENLQKLMALDPTSAPKVMDLLVEAMDFPGGDAIAKRFAPPDASGQPQGGAMDPMVQQQMEAQGQQMAELQGQLQQSTQQNQMLQFQVQHNAELEMQKTMAKLQSDQIMKQMDLNVQMAIAQMKEEGLNGRTQAQIMAEAQAANSKLMMEIANSRAQAMGGAVVSPPPGAIVGTNNQQNMGAPVVP